MYLVKKTMKITVVAILSLALLAGSVLLAKADTGLVVQADEVDAAPGSVIVTTTADTGLLIPAGGVEAPQNSPAIPDSVVVAAKFFVLKEDRPRTCVDASGFRSAGAGTVRDPRTVNGDPEAVAAQFVETPDLTALNLPEGYEVCWYSIKPVKDTWHVDGEIVKSETTAVNPPIGIDPQEPLDTDVDPQEPLPIDEDSQEEPSVAPDPAIAAAKFFVLKEDRPRTCVDASGFRSAGAGTVRDPRTVNGDPEAVAAQFVETPDLTALNLPEGYEVCWYSIKPVKDTWHVDGEIVKSENTTVEPPVTPGPVLATAKFFVLKDGKPRTSADASDFLSAGVGTVRDPEAADNNPEAVAAQFVETPDLTALGLAEGDEVCWYSIKPVGDAWHVNGEIIRSEQPVQEPQPQPDTLKATIQHILETGSRETHDISRFNATYGEVSQIFIGLRHNECRIAYNCYYSSTFKTTTVNGKIATFTLFNADEGFPERYANTLESIDQIHARADDSMSDLEKVLIAHEYIVSRTEYANRDNIAFTASGPLGLGYGVCVGYSDAMILMMDEFGIETCYLSSPKMNHAWLMVKLDGEWYHIDPTWSDTRSGAAGEVGHAFFLRSDDEFGNDPANKHYGWNENAFLQIPAATSTRYSNWFVHDVVGEMHYQNGLWYYLIGGEIVRSDIEGNSREVLVSGGGLKLVGVAENTLTYTQNGVAQTLPLD